MKIRQGFVSNSSSSSFVCDITGANESGYDIGLRDAGMAECVKGHTFVRSCIDGLDEKISELEEVDDDIIYEIPEEVCPICNGLAKSLIVKRIKKEMEFLKISVKDLK